MRQVRFNFYVGMPRCIIAEKSDSFPLVKSKFLQDLSHEGCYYTRVCGSFMKGIEHLTCFGHGHNRHDNLSILLLEAGNDILLSKSPCLTTTLEIDEGDFIIEDTEYAIVGKNLCYRECSILS